MREIWAHRSMLELFQVWDENLKERMQDENGVCQINSTLDCKGFREESVFTARKKRSRGLIEFDSVFYSAIDVQFVSQADPARAKNPLDRLYCSM